MSCVSIHSDPHGVGTCGLKCAHLGSGPDEAPSQLHLMLFGCCCLQYCRYLYYLGRIRAVQLQYSEARDCLQQVGCCTMASPDEPVTYYTDFQHTMHCVACVATSYSSHFMPLLKLQLISHFRACCRGGHCCFYLFVSHRTVSFASLNLPESHHVCPFAGLPQGAPVCASLPRLS